MEILQTPIAGSFTVLQAMGVAVALVALVFVLKLVGGMLKPAQTDAHRARMQCAACGWTGTVSKHKSRCASCGGTVLTAAGSTQKRA